VPNDATKQKQLLNEHNDAPILPSNFKEQALRAVINISCNISSVISHSQKPS